MSKPTAPTPSLLDDLEYGWHDTGPGTEGREHYDRLRAFLQSPAVAALSDPALAAAASVVITRLPELLEMEAKAAATWRAYEEGLIAGRYKADHSLTIASIDARNKRTHTLLMTLHAAAQAMSAEQRSCEAAKAQEETSNG